jgi:hypothetical protein
VHLRSELKGNQSEVVGEPLAFGQPSLEV